MTARVALYSAVDDILTHYEVDVEAATLTRKSSLRMPAKVQYAWPHPSSPHLYVSSSSGGPRVPSSDNFLSAFAIGADGALTPQGDSARLSRRAVHMCIDPTGRFALNGHNFPASGITVHRLEPDGSVGAEVKQSAALDYGTYPHQVMVFPSAAKALIVDRGNKAQDENNIAVYAIDPDTGEPTLVQHADTQSFHVRTFACDPSGRLLVTASIKPHAVLEGGEVAPVPAALSVFRIGDDGQLLFVRKYDVETTDGQMQYWMGMVG
jgi:6-phosphogluconolactonase (cycloisomerase 2 family)